jgi:REP element-mobilizing transposase RayT
LAHGRDGVEFHDILMLGYCVMSNHVHLIVVPLRHDAMAMALKQAHAWYASYWNVRHGSCGHVWQGGYYSCPLGQRHVWAALRYAELNPVRAGLVARAEDWLWSTAAAHGEGGPLQLKELNCRTISSERSRLFLKIPESVTFGFGLRCNLPNGSSTHSATAGGSAIYVSDAV